MQPDPGHGASDGARRPTPAGEPMHLVHGCQHRTDEDHDGAEPLALCGEAIDTLLGDVTEPPSDVTWCVVCADLAHSVHEANRCERCPQ